MYLFKLFLLSQVDTEAGSYSSKVPYKRKVMEVVEQKTKSMSVESVGDDGGNNDAKEENEGKPTESVVHEKSLTTKKEEEARGLITKTETDDEE